MKKHFISLFVLFFIVSCQLEEEADLDLSIDDVRGNPPGNSYTITGQVGEIYRFPRKGSAMTGFQLSRDNENNHKIYNTHSTWSKDSNWLIYLSTEGIDEYNGRRPNIFAVNMPGSNDNYEDFVTIQLTNHLDLPRFNTSGGASTEDIVISKNEDVLYYLRSNYVHGEDNMPHSQSYVKVMKLDFGAIIADACVMDNGVCTPGTMQPLSAYETTLFTHTWGNTATAGGITLDYSNQFLYYGINVGQSVIYRYDLNSNQNQEIFRSYSWTFGHLTANPFQNSNREVLFNWASNPQMPGFDDLSHTSVPHFNNVINGNGQNYIGLYNEHNPYENPTHATWVNANRIGFNIVNFGDPALSVGYCEINKNNTNFRQLVRSLSTQNESVFENNSMVPEPVGKFTILSEVNNTNTGVTHNLVVFDRISNQMFPLPIPSFGTEAHASASPDGKWVAYETRDHGFQVNVIQLQLPSPPNNPVIPRQFY